MLGNDDAQGEAITWRLLRKGWSDWFPVKGLAEQGVGREAMDLDAK